MHGATGMLACTIAPTTRAPEGGAVSQEAANTSRHGITHYTSHSLEDHT